MNLDKRDEIRMIPGRGTPLHLQIIVTGYAPSQKNIGEGDPPYGKMIDQVRDHTPFSLFLAGSGFNFQSQVDFLFLLWRKHFFI
jgi:hypothetical protein